MASASTGTIQANQKTSADIDSICKYIAGLTSVETREAALLELCKIRENVPELAPLLWNACGAIAALLQEICAIYPYINPPNLNAHQSNRVCNALALLQCLASHPDTRSDFLKANIPLYLYTFLNTNNRNRPFEYLRLTSLGVIGALVKTDEPEVIAFLLGSEIIPLCLVIMESGSELSKTVATFIMQKILLDDVGLAYICQTYERFVHVATVLDKVVNYLAKEQKLRLLKHVIRCYLRLSDDSRARDALRSCLPHQLTDSTFTGLLEDDMATKRCLNQLLRQVGIGGANVPNGGASAPPITTVTGSNSGSGGAGTTTTSVTGANSASLPPASGSNAAAGNGSGGNTTTIASTVTTTTAAIDIDSNSNNPTSTGSVGAQSAAEASNLAAN